MERLLRLIKLMVLQFLCTRKGNVCMSNPGKAARSVHCVSSCIGQSIFTSVRFLLSTRPTHGTPQQPTANLFAATSTTYVIKWSTSKKSDETENFFHDESYWAKYRPPEQASAKSSPDVFITLKIALVTLFSASRVIFPSAEIEIMAR